MRNRRAWFGYGLMAVLACTQGSAVSAYTLSSFQWPEPETTFYVDIPGANGMWNSTFEDAMAQWSGDTAFNYLIVTDEYRNPCNSPSGSSPARNGVDFSSTNCGDSWGSGVLATTTSYSVNGVRVQAGVLFNSNFSWAVYSGPWQWSVSDVRRVAMHELGHALGLGHEDVQSAIMSTFVGAIENPTADDLAGATALFGPAPESDTDGDGVPDGSDNCTLVANPTQFDSDGDDYGNHCDGDLNNNTVMNAQDYVMLRAQLGQPSVGPTYNEADLNCNGVVNAQDVVIFRSLLGEPPGPSGVVP